MIEAPAGSTTEPSAARRRPILERACLATLAFTGAFVGVWAAFAPRSWYDDFPGFGRVWVSPSGPYNEHFVRDVGDLYLALGVVAIVALVTGVRAAVLAAGLGWLTLGVPHLVDHLRNLDWYDTTDAIGMVATLLASVILPAIVVVSALRSVPQSEPSRPRSPAAPPS